jgi:hypothetical protein
MAEQQTDGEWALIIALEEAELEASACVTPLSDDDMPMVQVDEDGTETTV